MALSRNGGGQTGEHVRGTSEPEGKGKGPHSGPGHLLSSEWNGWQPSLVRSRHTSRDPRRVYRPSPEPWGSEQTGRDGRDARQGVVWIRIL